MPRKPRQACESGFYHVTARGVGRQLIFDDDCDHLQFLGLMDRFSSANGIAVPVWCLMGNHVHLLVCGRIEGLSKMMQSLQSVYAQYFNNRHGHAGHLFQGRFGCVPVNDDAQLLQTIRYIHLNPQKAGLSAGADYKWSSYAAFFAPEASAATSSLQGLFESRGAFEAFHRDLGSMLRFVSGREKPQGERRRLGDVEARALMEDMLGPGAPEVLRSLPKGRRDAVLCELKRAGLSVRQLERLTGLGRGLIQRARVPK